MNLKISSNNTNFNNFLIIIIISKNSKILQKLSKVQMLVNSHLELQKKLFLHNLFKWQIIILLRLAKIQHSKKLVLVLFHQIQHKIIIQVQLNLLLKESLYLLKLEDKIQLSRVLCKIKVARIQKNLPWKLQKK